MGPLVFTPNSPHGARASDLGGYKKSLEPLG
jgi:hypothetical protein